MDKTPGGNEVLDFDPNNLPQEHLAAIGLMSASAASTDDVIEMAIAGILGMDMEQGYAITTHMSAPQRIGVLKAAAEIRFENPTLLDTLDDLLAAIEKAARDRNEMIHGSWCVLPSTGQVHLVQQVARTHVEMSGRPVTIDEIKKKARALYDAGMELMRFLVLTNTLPEFPKDRKRGINTPRARKAARKKEDL